MITFIIVLLSLVSIVSAILLIAIIMMQQNKAGGGLGAVSGGQAEAMFGASAGNVLTKGTTWLAVIFLVATLMLAAVTGRYGTGRKSIIESANLPKTEKAAPAAEAPKAEEAKPAAEAQKAEEAKPAAENK